MRPEVGDRAAAEVAERAVDLADGRVYTGRQARALGLIDAIGGETEARAWRKSNEQRLQQLC